jgi:hypothetical protein
MSGIPPLSGDKQTFREASQNDASDPERTSAASFAVTQISDVLHSAAGVF